MTPILTTQNHTGGFYGAMLSFGRTPATAWNIAFSVVSENTRADSSGVRDFLDSPMGAHFADDVTNFLIKGLTLTAAVEAAARIWMGWRITARIAHSEGIPHGLPYLTGWVHHFAVPAKAA